MIYCQHLIFAYWSELVLDQFFSHHNLFYLPWGNGDSYAVTLQGVYGLRRAFALAGAKTLIATLWEIPVYASVILIERFFDNLERYMGKAAALKEAQMYLQGISVATLDRLPNGAGIKALTELHGTNYNLDDAFQPFRHPYFWAAWICQGDTGAMKYVMAKDLGKFTVEGKVVNLRLKA